MQFTKGNQKLNFMCNLFIFLDFRYNIEWIGREGLAPETHEEYLNDFINHFYKNVLKLVDRAMRKEDTSAQGKIVTEILQHLHACNQSVEVFYGRVQELEKLEKYITGMNFDLRCVSF